MRGLGTEQTLVLVNGRRMPSVPGIGDFLQSDISAIPITGIDRVETIGTTAAGIFGIGATGGAVNIVTKSEFEGVELVARSSIAQQGDAAGRALSGHIGYTSRGGHTRLSVRASRTDDGGLAFGDRSYIKDARQLRIKRDPSSFLPVSGSINIQTSRTQTLELLPSFGGKALNGSTTFLPFNAPAVGAGGAAVLVANAGRLDSSSAPDGQGDLASLVTPSRMTSLLATLRQDIGSHAAIFIDYLRLVSAGRSSIGAVAQGQTTLGPGEGGNPFQQIISVTFPTPGLVGHVRNRTTTDRLMIGTIVELGNGWTSSLDAATGRAEVTTATDGSLIASRGINFFQDGAAIASQLSAAGYGRVSETRATDRLRDVNLKIAGSPLRLPAGPASVTITGELREDRSPGEVDQRNAIFPFPPSTTSYSSQRFRVGSAFAEARVPLVADDSHLAALRGLEFQFALRQDFYELKVPLEATLLQAAGVYGSSVTARGSVTALTAGLRVTPVSGVMLRASFASGYTPPTPSQIAPVGTVTYDSIIDDPKRGGLHPGSTNQTVYLLGGSPNLRPQRARTLSIGAVLRPGFAPGFRLSIDDSFLKTTHEITDYALGDFQYFVDREDSFPGRITRAPPTPADIASGYSVGPITRVDASYLTDGQSSLQVVDAAFDYARETAVGKFQVYGRFAWQPTLKRRGIPNAPAFNMANSFNGPLALRGNAGIDWSRDAWSAGMNIQGYGSYRITYAYQPGSSSASSFEAANASRLLEQGALHIPAQFYVDGYVGFRSGSFSSSSHAPAISYRLGVRNLLGTRAPVVVPPLAGASDEVGYSTLGDARGRQFILEIATRF